MSSNKSGGSGLGLGTVLTLIFLVLKLLKLTDMSWFWVFFPIGLTTLYYGVCLLIIVLSVRKSAKKENNKTIK